MLRLASFVFAALLSLTAAAVAEDKPTLTVYTYDAFAADYGPGPGLKAGFEKTCGCTLNFVAADSSIGALRKVPLEGATTATDFVRRADQGAGKLQGRVGGPALRHAGPRPRTLDQGRLRRQGSRDLGGPQATHRDDGAQMVRCLWAVAQGRGRFGAELHDVAGLPRGG